MYFAVTSGFVEVFKIPSDGLKQFYFLCVIAFLASGNFGATGANGVS